MKTRRESEASFSYARANRNHPGRQTPISRSLVSVARGFSQSAIAEKRVALTIGNSTYQHVSHLTNPANDAAVMMATFKRADFDVGDPSEAGVRSPSISKPDGPRFNLTRSPRPGSPASSPNQRRSIFGVVANT